MRSTYLQFIRCIFPIFFSMFFVLGVEAQPPGSVTEQYLTRIVPDVLDEQVVYPTNYAIIALDPLYAYQWEQVIVPASWGMQGYTYEIWDGQNQIIPGFDSRKLEVSSIDLNLIDPSLYPQIRLIVFQPEGVPDLDYMAPIYFTYSEQKNSRLFVFLGLIVLINIAVGIGVLYYRVSLRELLRATRQLLRSVSKGDTQRDMVVHAALTLLWSTVFAIVLGTFVGGIQILYVMIKLPFLLLGSLLFTLSSNILLSVVLGVRASFKAQVTQALSVTALMSLVLASFTPILFFFIIIPQNHDQLLVSTVWFFSMAGLFGAYRFYKWLQQNESTVSPLLVTIVWVCLYGVVILQLGWLLRPWVGVIDSVQNAIPFTRLYAGNVFIELINTMNRL